jgi:hypothetical protein
MLLQHHGLGHAEYIWKLRQNLKIILIFSTLWNVPPMRLLVSFDGISVHLPPESTRKGWRERARKTELHVDQSLLNSNLESYQSWITANDVNENDATLVVLKGSHLLHAEFAEFVKGENKMSKTPEKDWYRLSEPQVQWYLNRGCEKVFVQCPRGSLCIWDSRTIHCGMQASNKRKVPNLRHVVYLCYTPRCKATEEHLRNRRKWFEQARMTSHKPHSCRVFSKSPRVFAANHLDFNMIRTPPALTRLGRRLVGYED